MRQFAHNVFSQHEMTALVTHFSHLNDMSSGLYNNYHLKSSELSFISLTVSIKIFISLITESQNVLYV